MRDAAVNSLLGEAASLLLLLVSQVGAGLVTHLQTDVLPSLGLSVSQQVSSFCSYERKPQGM